MDTKPKKIVLLGAALNTRNMGVLALATGAVTSALNTYADAEIYLFDYLNRHETYTVDNNGQQKNIELINIRFSKKFWLPNNIARLLFFALLIKAIPIRSIRKKMYQKNYWFNFLTTSDFICSIAGGDSFSDIYGLQRLFYVSFPQILVILLGKQLLHLPQTLGPFNTSWGKTTARFILNRSFKIFSRDKESIDNVYKLIHPNNKNKLIFSYDLGFVLKPKIEEDRIPSWFSNIFKNSQVVGLNLSGLLYIGGYTRDNMFNLKSNYKALIQQLIEFFIKEKNKHVVLVPHVVGETMHRESDVTVCQTVLQTMDSRLYDKLHVFEPKYNHHEIKALIGFCDFFMGSRMHSCIAGLSQHVPSVGLAYSRKFRGVYGSIDVPELVVDLREHDEKSVVKQIEAIYQKKALFREHLEKTMPKVKTEVLSLFKDIK